MKLTDRILVPTVAAILLLGGAGSALAHDPTGDVRAQVQAGGNVTVQTDNDPTEPTEATEPTEPTEATEPTEPTEATETKEPAEATEAADGEKD